MTVVSQDPHKLHVSTMDRKPGWFSRLREWWTVVSEPRVEADWTEMESVQAPPRRPEPQPTHMIEQQPQPQPRPVHPQFAMQPADSAHVLDRMQHLLVDLRGDSAMTPMRALEALRPLNEELSSLAREQFTQQRRMDRNQGVAVAQAALLEDAVRLGKDEAAVKQAAEGIAGRAVHVADPEQTSVGAFAPITENTPDPRTVAQPVDVNPGDVEPAASPVHSDGAPAIPEPAAAFLGGSGEFALPKREPQSPLAHEVPDAAPTAVLPVQGDRTEVMPAFAGAGVADPGEGSDVD